MIEKNQRLFRFAHRLDVMPFSVCIADASAEDLPLIFMNRRFKNMTGYGEEYLGHNCRFLQGDRDNSKARASLRAACTYCKRTQVVLKNRRVDGERFSNLLHLDFVGTHGGRDHYAVGTQFDLGDLPFGERGYVVPQQLSQMDLADPFQRYKMVIERQRALSESLAHLIGTLLVVYS